MAVSGRLAVKSAMRPSIRMNAGWIQLPLALFVWNASSRTILFRGLNGSAAY